jgi:hypothetical protein
MTRRFRLTVVAALTAVLTAGGLGLVFGSQSGVSFELQEAVANTEPGDGALGHLHPEPDGTLFCHCSGDKCKPCG